MKTEVRAEESQRRYRCLWFFGFVPIVVGSVLLSTEWDVMNDSQTASPNPWARQDISSSGERPPILIREGTDSATVEDGPLFVDSVGDFATTAITPMSETAVVSPESSKVARLFLLFLEQREGMGEVPPGLEALLSEIEKAQAAENYHRFFALSRRLTDGMKRADAEVRELLLDLGLLWLEQFGVVDHVRSLFIKGLFAIDDPEFHRIRFDAFLAKQTRFREDRETDPVILTELLESDGSWETKGRLVAFLQGEELEDGVLRLVLKRIARGEVDAPDEVRRMAIFKEAEFLEEGTQEFLESLIDTELNTEARRAAWGAYAKDAESPDVARLLEGLINDPDPVVQRFAAIGIARQPTDPGVVAGLVEAYREKPDLQVRKNVIRAMGKHAAAAVIGEELLRIVGNDPVPTLRHAAVIALAGSELPQVRAMLREARMNDVDREVRSAADAILSTFGADKR